MTAEGAERRRFPRRPIYLKVKYRSLDTFFYDYAINVSHGGLFIKTRRPLARGTELEIEFEVPGAASQFRTRGQVVRVVAPGQDEFEPAGMGIAFEPLSAADLDLIDLLWHQSAKEKGTP